MADNDTPKTKLGCELDDLIRYLRMANADDKTIQAAILGRSGVCASCWGPPHGLRSHSDKSMGASTEPCESQP